MEMDLKEVCVNTRKLIDSAQVRDCRASLVNTALNNEW